MKKVDIYTDGACSGNPGPGGWGAILCYGGVEKEISGGEPHTTNNRMELMGVISALSMLKEPCEVTLYSDSQYVCNALERGWARKWQSQNWMRTKKDPALNPDLWEKLLAGSAICTAGELLFGLLFNRDHRIWDYRGLPLNFRGQICPVFSLLWIPVSGLALWLYRLCSAVLMKDPGAR